MNSRTQYENAGLKSTLNESQSHSLHINSTRFATSTYQRVERPLRTSYVFIKLGEQQFTNLAQSAKSAGPSFNSEAFFLNLASLPFQVNCEQKYRLTFRRPGFANAIRAHWKKNEGKTSTKKGMPKICLILAFPMSDVTSRIKIVQLCR